MCITLKYTYSLIEGSFEAKLPTVWTDEKQRREESEKRGEEKRREQQQQVHYSYSYNSYNCFNCHNYMSNHTTTTLQPHLQPQFSLQLQHYIFNNINYTTTTSTLQLRLQVHLQLQLQLHCTSLHHTTSCSCGRGGHCNHSKNHNHLGPSVDLLCHPCITTTHLSYSFLSLKLLPPPCAVLLEI